MSAPPPKKPGGTGLYGDLLNPGSGGVISGAPVKYEMKRVDPEAEAKKKKDAALKFQPVMRPQQTKQKPKSKPNWSSSSAAMPSSSAMTASSPGQQTQVTPQPAQQQRSKFSDWVGNEDEEFFFDNRPKAQRGGKKAKRKKQNKGQREEQQEMDWDAIYDPARPTILSLYRGSTEQEDERRDWKDHLYRHAAKKKGGAAKSKPKNRMFAPLGGLSFAPPSFNDDTTAASPMDIDNDNDYSRSASAERGHHASSSTPVAVASTSIPDDATGEDAYMRRMRLSGMMQSQPSAPPPPPAASVARPSMASSSPVPPRASAAQPPADAAAKLAAAKAKIAAAKAAFDAKKSSQSGNGQSQPSTTPPFAALSPHLPPPPPGPETPGSSISRAPVRYNLAEAQIDQVLDRQDHATPPQQQQAQQPRSKMPGQANFGARMLAKQGWKAGEGLGAKGEGITTALVAQQQKRKKRSDKDGGGWAHPPIGKIVGGKKRKIESAADDDGAHGAISQVVKLTGMLEGLDVTYELEENNLQQEIGEGFEKDYGSIERVLIWREQQGGGNEVFVKFTNQVSALKCVNGCDGMTFADNPVKAKFFSTEKFEGGEYV